MNSLRESARTTQEKESEAQAELEKVCQSIQSCVDEIESFREAQKAGELSAEVRIFEHLFPISCIHSSPSFLRLDLFLRKDVKLSLLSEEARPLTFANATIRKILQHLEACLAPYIKS